MDDVVVEHVAWCLDLLQIVCETATSLFCETAVAEKEMLTQAM